MSDETRQVLSDIEEALCDLHNTDKHAATMAEMQAFNRGIAEGMRLIRKLLNDDNNELLHSCFIRR